MASSAALTTADAQRDLAGWAPSSSTLSVTVDADLRSSLLLRWLDPSIVDTSQQMELVIGVDFPLLRTSEGSAEADEFNEAMASFAFADGRRGVGELLAFAEPHVVKMLTASARGEHWWSQGARVHGKPKHARCVVFAAFPAPQRGQEPYLTGRRR